MQDLTKGKVWKKLLLFSTPIFLGNILQQLYNTVDAIIVGRYVGTRGLAAVGVSMPIMMLQAALLIGIGSGVEILVARYIGKKDDKMVKQASDSLLSAILVLSVLIGVIGYFLSRPILMLISTPADILDQATLYLQIIFIGIPGLAGYNTLNGLIRSTGNSVQPFMFLALATILNIGLDFVFVGVLTMGVAGAAFATVIAQTTAFIACYIYINIRKGKITYHLSNLDINIDTIKAGFKLGIPSSVQHGALSLGMILLQSIVNPLGSITVAAYTVGMRIDSFAGMPVTNLSQAVTTFTSQNIGADKKDRVIKLRKVAIRMGYTISLLVLAVIWLFGHNIVGWFVDDANVAKIALHYIRVLTIAYIPATYFTIILGQIRGAGNTWVPMIIMMVGHWLIRLPVAKLLSANMGYMGIWISIPVGWGVSFIITLFYIRSKWYKQNLTLYKE